MAKYSVSYENNIITHELTFRGKTFDYTMKELPDGLGRSSDKKAFDYQLAETFDDLTLEQLTPIIDSVTDTFDEDEVFKGLAELEALE